jgi:CRISPR-associated protein Csd2
MFEHDHSAARGEMTTCKLIAFRHDSALGNARAHDLFKRVKVGRSVAGEIRRPGDRRLDNLPPARSFDDYAVEIDDADMPAGVEILELV